MGKYCGDSIPPSHVSSSNEILIQFQSDGSITYNGFKMEYNPTGNTSIQNNFEYYGDYHTELREYSLFLDDFFFHIELIKIPITLRSLLNEQLA